MRFHRWGSFAVAVVLATQVLPTAPAPAAEPVPGGSIDCPVDDALFARLGKAARSEVFARHSIFTTKDLDEAIQRREPLGLKPLATSLSPLSDEEFQRRASQATLVLFTISEKDHQAGRPARLGTAFMVHKNLAATCFHALKGLGEPFGAVALTAEGKTVRVRRIAAVYPQEDLAFLEVEGAGDRALPLRADAPAGTRVRALGHPLNKYYFAIEGTIARYGLKTGTGSEKIPRLNLMIDSIGGFSGGALIDSAGNAVGMLDSYDTIKAGNATYTVHSAIPAASILAHFTKPCTAPLSPEARAAALKPDPPGKERSLEVRTIRSESPQGAAVAEVRSDEPKNYEIRIEAPDGTEIARGRPSAGMREGLPEWARALYDNTCRTADTHVENILHPDAARKAPASGPRKVLTHRVEAKGGGFTVAAEASSIAPKEIRVTVKDTAGKVVAEGKASPEFRESLPADARAVYDVGTAEVGRRAGGG